MNKAKVSLIITAGVIFLVAGTLFFLKQTDYSYLSLDCDKTVTGILAENGIEQACIKEAVKQPVSGFRKKALYLEREVLLERKTSLDELKSLLLNTDFSPLSIEKIQEKKTKQEQILTFDLSFDKLKIYRLILIKKRVVANIALVIDDWGYNEKTLENALQLEIPITYAILPNLPYSSKIAAILYGKGYEFILHLPLEPYEAEKQPLEKNTLFTSMEENEIRQIISDDFASLPNLKGVNNHMGSKATENEYLMTILFDQIKQNNLYFLDSYTSKNSVAAKIANEKDVPLISRDIFIDNKSDAEYIRERLNEAKTLAIEKGIAIVIGHAKDLTIDTIREMIPEFKKEAINFVYLSQILETDPKPAVSSEEAEKTQ